MAAEAWGIRCLRYEIRDIQLPSKVKEAMQRQVRERVAVIVVTVSNGVDWWGRSDGRGWLVHGRSRHASFLLLC